MSNKKIRSISIVIPAYNEEKYIKACLDSAVREAKEAKARTEIIVVDNASTDNTASIARAYTGVKVVYEKEKGLVRARQAGYLAGQGELVANIDADTLMPRGWLKRVIYEFERDPELVALSGPCQYIDMPHFFNILVKAYYFFGLAMNVLLHPFSRPGMLQGGNYVLSRSALDRINGYDTTIDFYGEDTDIALRISAVGKVKFCFALAMKSSARRLRQEGIMLMAWRYGMNYLWMLVFGRPFSKKSRHIRQADR